jgi:TPP-dependent indolepyruvate ferredoxin oxidoreductase alpha subunit
MSQTLTETPERAGNITSVAAPTARPGERKGLTKKEIAADHPTWCPGCGDFSVLALYFKLIEKRKMWHEKITTVAGIGCSSRFPYFVQAHGAHFIHGRALPFASGISFRGPTCTFSCSAATAMPFPSAAIISTTPRARTSR